MHLIFSSLSLFIICFCLCCESSSEQTIRVSELGIKLIKKMYDVSHKYYDIQIMSAAGLLFEDSLTTVIKNADVCSQGNDSAETELVIIVDSDSRNLNMRNRIRGLKRHWLSERTKNVPIVFFIEQTSDSQDNYQDVLSEEDAHHDIMWTISPRKSLDEEDKTQLYFYWINIMCNRAKFVLKIPDNITVDFQKIMKIIDENQDAHNTLWTFPKPTNPIEWDPHYLYAEKVYLMTSDVVKLLPSEINYNVLRNKYNSIQGLARKYEETDKINHRTLSWLAFTLLSLEKNATKLNE